MTLLSILIPFFLLTHHLFAETKLHSHTGSLTHKTELKFLIPDLTKIPPDLIRALETGEFHQDILRRGLVVQQYLAVTRKNIFKIFRELQTAGIPFGSDKQMNDFLFPGKTQEIRLMRKNIKEGNQSTVVYQIGLQGNGEISSDKIETPATLSVSQLQKMKDLFESLQTEVTYTIQKLCFECTALDQNNNPIKAQDGSLRTVEVDIFFTTIDGKIVPFFIDGEIKFQEDDRQQALLAANELQKKLTTHLSFLGLDITGSQALKARNIGLLGLPSEIRSLFEKFSLSNTFFMTTIQEEYQKWIDPNLAKLAFETPPKSKQTIRQRVLLNAEAFGFGPSAAIAEFFPYLRDKIHSLAYVGSGHTLNLQSKLPYDEVFNLGSVDIENRQDYFNCIAKDYDVLITASDFEVALWAKQAGLKVIIYDPLTWYWPHLPTGIQQADFYIAQNFFGVAERLKGESEQFPEAIIVPPIVSGISSRKSTNTLLVNMGGLSNPYLEEEDIQTFASVIFNTVHQVLHSQFQDIHFVTNKKIAESLHGPYQVTTLLPSEVQEILSQSRLAIMTSGLGNIYEAAAMKKEILWLPPANDSQGQQIKLLQQHHMIDFSIDWHHLLDNEDPIDYFAPQEEVLQRIAMCMRKLKSDLQAQAKLKSIIEKTSMHTFPSQPALAKLTKVFEVDGAKQAAENILQWLFDHNLAD